jgi:hypothetical protein
MGPSPWMGWEVEFEFEFGEFEFGWAGDIRDVGGQDGHHPERLRGR